VRSFAGLTLRAERTLLRPLRDTDAEALYVVFSDPRVMRYWNTPPWSSMAEAHDSIARDAPGMERGEHARLGIEHVSDARLIGACSLFNISEQCRRAEIGYAFAYDVWGNGYAQESLRALLEYAFTECGLHRLEADIDPRNTASGRLLERLGFAREGILRERWIVGDEVSDSALYGLLAREWRERTTQAFPGTTPRSVR
jgi:RimJ/RimL family protein N-acetyltransferase